MATAAKKTAETISIGEAAALLKVSDERVRQLVKMGYIKRVARGRFHLTDVVHGYIDFRNDDDRRSSKSATASRMHDAKAAKIELEIAEKKRELVPVEEAQAAIDIVIGKVNAEFSGLPARFTRDMTLRRKLEDEIDDSFNTIAAAVSASAEFLRQGGELPGEAGEEDAG